MAVISKPVDLPPAPRILPTIIAAVLACFFVIFLFATQKPQQGIMFLIALGLGATLYHARFGFTSAFRQLMAVGHGGRLRAHMLMLMVATLLFAPLLALGKTAFGEPLSGNVYPLGIAIVVGSFLFCVGMQLGGACASGSLYTVGAGHTSLILTLLGFLIGSAWGAHDFAFWMQPSFVGSEMTLTDTRLGYAGGLVFQLLIIGTIVAITWLVERKMRPPHPEPAAHEHGWRRALRGAWPLWVGAIALAVLNAATLWVSGKPWGVTSAFALWGSKAAAVIGFNPGGWSYWADTHSGELNGSILADGTSMMNIGIIFGAMAASAWGGTFKIARDLPWRMVLGRILGGILMGYGARLAFGCNIGAYFSGIASMSLHGWLWGIVGLGGTFAGLKLRPLFGLPVPRRTD